MAHAPDRRRDMVTIRLDQELVTALCGGSSSGRARTSVCRVTAGCRRVLHHALLIGKRRPQARDSGSGTVVLRRRAVHRSRRPSGSYCPSCACCSDSVQSSSAPLSVDTDQRVGSQRAPTLVARSVSAWARWTSACPNMSDVQRRSAGRIQSEIVASYRRRSRTQARSGMAAAERAASWTPYATGSSGSGDSTGALLIADDGHLDALNCRRDLECASNVFLQ